MTTALYTAEALSTGDGRNGHGRTSDGRLDLDFAAPTELGGSGNGTNPEQLFALGYAACYHNALRRIAKEAGADVTDSSVGARVSLVPGKDGARFALAVQLEVTLPHADHETAAQAAELADQVCPYSAATRGNIDVEITVTDD